MNLVEWEFLLTVQVVVVWSLSIVVSARLIETAVAVTLARPLHVSKIGQSKEKGKTKQATLIL